MSEYNHDIVAFGPHPDDVEMCCAGLLIKMAKAGHKTAVVDLTQGELGTRGSKETRSAEASAAAKAMGLAHRENVALPDGGINPYETAEAGNNSQLSKLVGVIRRLKPELVLIPYIYEGRHPDHSAGAVLINRAVFFAGLARFYPDLGERFVPRQVICYQMRDQFRPSFLVDITEVSEKKLEAIRCYKSQFGLDQSSAEDQLKTLLTSDHIFPAIEARERYHGGMIGVAKAEAYYLETGLGIADPVEHFRKNSAVNALFGLDRR
jgi:bacillithiol biosynthesis deacetylase BshB1